MAIKRDATDAIVSDLIREAADWTCERCSKPFPERKSYNLHASHYIGRATKSTRYFPDNISSLCGECHRVLTNDHHEHYHFMMKRLGGVRYDELQQRKNRVMRYRNSDLAELRSHYRGELERVQRLRRGGVVGYVEVVSYD